LIGFALPDLRAKLAQKATLNAQLQNMQKLCILLAKKNSARKIFSYIYVLVIEVCITYLQMR